MRPSRKTDLQRLTEAATLFAKLSGACLPESVASSLEACNEPIGDQVVSLRQAYERYLAECSCPMQDLVAMAKRGDMLLRFGAYVRLDDILKTGRLDRLYRKTLKQRDSV